MSALQPPRPRDHPTHLHLRSRAAWLPAEGVAGLVTQCGVPALYRGEQWWDLGILPPRDLELPMR